MLWFILAVLISALIAFDPSNDGLVDFVSAVFLFGLLSLFLNFIFAGVKYEHTSTKKCDLVPIVKGVYVIHKDENFYYKCSGSDLESKINNSDVKIKIAHDEPSFFEPHLDKRNLTLSIFDSSPDSTLYIPDGLVQYQ